MSGLEHGEPSFEPAREHDSLSAWLDYQRSVLLWKIEGVSDEDLRRPMVPSGTSLLGLVKHLALVERGWFQEVFTAEADDLGDEGWQIPMEETAASVVAFYREQCERARRITAGASLDDVAVHDEYKPTLRWILSHMIEETARHNGHADILRELIDGTIGDRPE